MENQTNNHKKNIDDLANKLDSYLNILLRRGTNIAPTITSTFYCIENSSRTFKGIIKNNISLEHEIKSEIGKILVVYSKDKEFMRPPYKNYFVDIINNLTS